MSSGVESPNQVSLVEQARGGEPQVLQARSVSLSELAADSYEEMSFVSGRFSRDLSRRLVSDGRLRLSEVQAMLEEYLRRVPDLERQHRLEALVAQLSSGALHNLEQLTAYLQSFSSEVSHQFVALAYARQELAKKTGTGALLALIEQALLTMDGEHGEAIELGMRIEPLARKAAAQGVGEIQVLRDIYRDTLQGCKGIQDYKGLRAAWEGVVRRFGSIDIAGVAVFMREALSADIKALSAVLNSPRALRDPVVLQLLISDMSKLQQLTSFCGEVKVFWRTTITREEGHGIRAF